MSILRKECKLSLRLLFLLLIALSRGVANAESVNTGEPTRKDDAKAKQNQQQTSDEKSTQSPDSQSPDSKTNQAPAITTTETIKTEGVEIKAKKFRIITPMPGLLMDKSTSTTNIQSATGKEIAESKALNVTEFMNNEIQSVSINDYAGNPFQQDLNFRGFTASPSIGTPQGISVYMDGVRINEAFGDVVNWDLIPMNAIQSLDLIPGSNPMFGLNTLGGALAIRTKTGFTDQHARGQILVGDWGRQQTQFSNGINNGTVGLFTAYNHFEEDGWRKNSPSSVRQLYNNATIKLPMGEFNFSALNIDTNLTGNGMLPFETAAIDKTQVFTSPDGSKSSLGHYNLNGRWDVSDNMSISGLAYLRKLNQSAISGDVYDPYRELRSSWGDDVNIVEELVRDANGDFLFDENGDFVIKNVNLPGGDTTKINGMFNNSFLKQTSKGVALQATWELEKHQIATGITYDTNKIAFIQSQLLGEIDENHVINQITDPAPFLEKKYFVVNTPIVRNNLKGSSTTTSFFMTDTWSPRDNLHISYGARFNWTSVQNTLISDVGKELYNFRDDFYNPIRQKCRVQGEDSRTIGRFVCSSEAFNYFSFNPAIGITWEVNEDLTSYANISRGARTPTVIELGCANDKTKSNEPTSTNYQFGCSIPTSLSSDPYLKQVRSTAYEAGFRGNDYGFDWNIGVFRTELKDDILFVPLGRKNRGVFDNFGETLRQGIEMGMKGQLGKSKLSLNYTYMLATFESPSRVVNNSNSTNTARFNPQDPGAYVNIEPGDELPGMPNHIVQASWGYQLNERFDTTLSMVMHSSAYVRGNENNDHQPRNATNNTTDRYDYIGSGSTAGYAVFNFRANYKVNKGITAFLKVDNLFDTTYANGGALGRNPFNAAGAFLMDTTQWKNTTFIASGAPFAAWVGLTFDLDWGKFKSLKPTE